MAAAAGTALLRPVATKMGMTIAPRAPSLHHHHPLFAGLRGARPGPTSSRNLSSSSSASSGSPPPPINNKKFTQTKNVPGELNRAKVASLLTHTKVACVVMFGTSTFMYFCVKPRLDALINEVNDLRRERSILIKAVEECQRTHIKTQEVLADSSQS